MTVSDWDRRELCSDGSCTGLIGPEGTCKVCGRAAPNWGDERKRGTQDATDDDEDEAEDDVDGASADPIQPAARVAIGGGEWGARTLCPDGACVGVIGANGTCKVCGKVGVAAPADEDEDADAEYEDEDDEEYEDEDDELAAAADELAGVASSTEVDSAKELAQSGGDDDENRKLCSDGACIGVIGEDGKCKVCGKEPV